MFVSEELGFIESKTAKVQMIYESVEAQQMIIIEKINDKYSIILKDLQNTSVYKLRKTRLTRA